jgi:hypothetical protein
MHSCLLFELNSSNLLKSEPVLFIGHAESIASFLDIILTRHHYSLAIPLADAILSSHENRALV